METVISNS